MTTIRLILALASSLNWHLHRLDVNMAFLHGDLHEEVYMCVPLGLQTLHSNLACRLTKSLYGLKQASCQWNAKLTESLISSGYAQSKADYSLFTKSSATRFSHSCLCWGFCVNRKWYAWNLCHQEHSSSKAQHQRLRWAKVFSWVEIGRSKNRITLYQRKYALDLLNDTGMLASKPCSTPVGPNLKINKD